MNFALVLFPQDEKMIAIGFLVHFVKAFSFVSKHSYFTAQIRLWEVFLISFVAIVDSAARLVVL